MRDGCVMATEKSLVEPFDEKRLWLGNLDSRITEYQLIKMLQKYGTIEKFDLLFHRSGPLTGLPRGYAFVTFLNKEDAVKAKSGLNNKLLGTKCISVMWAHSLSKDEPEVKLKPDVKLPVLAMAKQENKIDRESQIQAIEAKLKIMQHKAKDELEINKTVATEPPVISLYQKKQESHSSNPSTSTKLVLKKYNEKRNQFPYTKPKPKR
ncbi:probable RNA-binding protein 18 [Agrilus planipennis]|uniref:Probable RNA-binding protein 18 n=1 Tax=Agrilus planipennis TaxID=224129 RepID=A0A1W4WMF3_AGRPL|nr:probable RNA-binding protein 18 [Agrilus planipennis]